MVALRIAVVVFSDTLIDTPEFPVPSFVPNSIQSALLLIFQPVLEVMVNLSVLTLLVMHTLIL